MNIEQEVEAIKERNRNVEADKAWEQSWTRRFFIGLVTYAVAGIWLTWIHDTNPWFKALVPSGGYILSTLSLLFIKKRWISKK